MGKQETQEWVHSNKENTCNMLTIVPGTLWIDSKHQQYCQHQLN